MKSKRDYSTGPREKATAQADPWRVSLTLVAAASPERRGGLTAGLESLVGSGARRAPLQRNDPVLASRLGPETCPLFGPKPGEHKADAR